MGVEVRVGGGLEAEEFAPELADVDVKWTLGRGTEGECEGEEGVVGGWGGTGGAGDGGGCWILGGRSGGLGG